MRAHIVSQSTNAVNNAGPDAHNKGIEIASHSTDACKVCNHHTSLDGCAKSHKLHFACRCFARKETNQKNPASVAYFKNFIFK